MTTLANEAGDLRAATPARVTNGLQSLVAWAVALSVAATGVAALILVFRLLLSDPKLLSTLVTGHVGAIVGIPMAACSAFCVLLFLESRSGDVEFSGLGFSFKGAAGPTVIWVLVFLAFSGAIHLLW